MAKAQEFKLKPWPPDVGKSGRGGASRIDPYTAPRHVHRKFSFPACFDPPVAQIETSG